VAYWGSTGNGLAPAQDFLDRVFFLALFHEGIGELGAAVTYAKQYLLDNNPPGAYHELKVKVADNCVVLDSDNDSVPDSVEIGPDPANPVDTDGDGLPDYLDDDDYNDLIRTISEDIDLNGTPLNDDSDSDDIPNYLDYDPAGYLYKELNKQLISWSFGLRVLFGPQEVDEFREIEPDQAEAVITGLAGMADYLIVDLPVHDRGVSRAVIGLCDHITLVVEPEPTSLASSKRALKLLKSWGISERVVGLVAVNRTMLAVSPAEIRS